MTHFRPHFPWVAKPPPRPRAAKTTPDPFYDPSLKFLFCIGLFLLPACKFHYQSEDVRSLDGDYTLVTPHDYATGILCIRGNKFNLIYRSDGGLSYESEGYCSITLDGQLLLVGQDEVTSAKIYRIEDYVLFRLMPGAPLVLPNEEPANLISNAIGSAYVPDGRVAEYRNATFTGTPHIHSTTTIIVSNKSEWETLQTGKADSKGTVPVN